MGLNEKESPSWDGRAQVFLEMSAPVAVEGAPHANPIPTGMARVLPGNGGQGPLTLQPHDLGVRLLSHPVAGYHWAGDPVTSLISLILEPPLPIRDPHWLAGTTSLSVTGGLLVAGLLLMELMMSWGRRVHVLANNARSGHRESE